MVQSFLGGGSGRTLFLGAQGTPHHSLLWSPVISKVRVTNHFCGWEWGFLSRLWCPFGFYSGGFGVPQSPLVHPSDQWGLRSASVVSGIPLGPENRSGSSFSHGQDRGRYDPPQSPPVRPQV